MMNDTEKASPTILSVDDSPDKLELLSVVLREAGYRVLTASNGLDGLKIAKQEIPDLIISDVSMPGMDGLELCRLIRTDEGLRRVPIMLVTALRKDTQTLALGLAAGADDYLEAPFDAGRLVAKIARLIERKRTDDLAILASIVENSEESIIGKSLDGTITSWNFGAERIYGYKAVISTVREGYLSGSTNTEPGAVATGSRTQRNNSSNPNGLARFSPTCLFDPVATAPGSEFVDPRLRPVSLGANAHGRVLFVRSRSAMFTLSTWGE